MAGKVVRYEDLTMAGMDAQVLVLPVEMSCYLMKDAAARAGIQSNLFGWKRMRHCYWRRQSTENNLENKLFVD
jgi:hypothetical protein